MQQVYKGANSHLEPRLFADFEAFATNSSADARRCALTVRLAACTQLNLATTSISRGTALLRAYSWTPITSGRLSFGMKHRDG